MADNRPLSFKNFTQEDVELFEESQTLDEVLSISGRRKKARDAKRRKTVLKLARKRARRRMARDPVLKKRSRRSARKAIAAKLLKGRKKSELSDVAKASIEKRLDRPSFQKRLDVMQRRLMPKKRKAEIIKSRRRKGIRNKG